jgi:alkylhydroperoxidase family enzyme
MTTTTTTINPFAAGTSPAPDCQGYHPIAIVADGELLCEHCVMDASNPIIDGTGRLPADGDPADDQWTVVAWTNSGDLDDHGEQCGHCYRRWFS